MTNGEKYKSAKERAEAFDEYAIGKCTLNEIHADNYLETAFAWLDLEAEEEKPLPCPFCGTVVHDEISKDGLLHYLECGNLDCVYCSGMCSTKSLAIATHNRVARAVKEANDANS